MRSFLPRRLYTISSTDLDCDDNGVPNNVKVLQPDPHRLDGDRDGVGCRGNGNTGGVDSSNNNDDNDRGSTSANECQGKLIASEEQ